MPIPESVRPDTFVPINFSGSACDQFRQLLSVSERLGVLLGYLFDDSGNPTNEFLGDLKKWQYGAVASTGTSGAYVVVSTPPYSTVATSPLHGRVVFFIANHDSPSSGSTLALDGLTPLPLVSNRGVAVGLKQIVTGMLVMAISDGSSFYVINELSKAGATFETRRSYDSTTSVKATNGAFPAVMTITLTKPAGALWDCVHLHVTGNFGSNAATGKIRCDITFTDGPSGGAAVTGGSGAGNLSVEFPIEADNDAVSPAWQWVMDLPAGYQSLNSVSFTATISIVGSVPGNNLSRTQAFFGFAEFTRPQA